MNTKAIRFSLALTLFLGLSKSQENAQFRIPKSLEECYRDPQILQRDNRLPMTITQLIDIIKKVENSDGFTQDITQLTVSLLHRFRLDGIQPAHGAVNSPSIIPYSPSDFQFSKHRLLLTRLIQGDGQRFPNDTLTAMEKCSLHFMLSSSFDRTVRGDEGQRCPQMANFRAMRIPRDINVKDSQRKNLNNFAGDIEMIDNWKKQQRSGKYVEGDRDDAHDDHPEHVDGEDDEEGPIEGVFHSIFPENDLIDVASSAISQCPVESGVIWTKWGTVSAGTLIAGIAAGLKPQKVNLRTLLAYSSRPRNLGPGSRQMDSAMVDSKWAATLAGDLAEVTLIQAPMTSQISTGASGIWNSTTSPHWYFLSQRERLEITDAEIRGGLDGLIIATNIAKWMSAAPTLKLSQLLDMYYSNRGVLNSGIKACERRNLFTTVVPMEELKAQTNAFSHVLDREMQLRVTLTGDAIRTFSGKAADTLSTYIVQSLNDLSCEAATPPGNDKTILQASTDLYIFVDTTWQFLQIDPVISHILENINVSPHGTRVTILNAKDAVKIVNTTDSLSDIYQSWNYSTYMLQPKGLSLPNILTEMHNISLGKLLYEKETSSAGGRSLVALIITQMETVNDEGAALERLDVLNRYIPDFRLLFLASGSVGRFDKFVKDPKKDLFPLLTGDKMYLQANSVITRIQGVPRRIINYRCGSNWHAEDSGQSNLNQYIEPGSVNYYSIAPNYFFEQGGDRYVRIQGQGRGSSSLTVCSSRSVEQPRQNTTDGVTCRQITSDTFDIDLNNPCEGSSYIRDCSPVYFSVEAPFMNQTVQATCTDRECRYPDETKYLIQTQNLGCYSNANHFVISGFLLFASIIFSLNFF